MIALNLPASFSDPEAADFVARLGRDARGEAVLAAEFEGREVYQTAGQSIDVAVPEGDTLAGDIIFAEPGAGRVSRWIRRGSVHNTLLVTERCDQLCIMCSQPPRKSHRDLFRHFLDACLRADPGTRIGLSGGEPLLFREEVFDLIERVIARRPDIGFHVLTNGQHFVTADRTRLLSPAFRKVQWGIPLYAADPCLHDEIVAKLGGQARLFESLAVLAEAGQSIELRTVLLQQNYAQLEPLARLVAARLPFLSVWALMQLERAGFARNRWTSQFVDHSADPAPLERAVSIAAARGLRVALYNIPHCTVSDGLAPYLHNSISDWKRAFPRACESCRLKPVCCGFFEWHAELGDYTRGGAR